MTASSLGEFHLTGNDASLDKVLPGPGPGPGGPFYFAWADSSETSFNSSHYVYDETIFNFNLTHDEGQIPTLELEMVNPNIGLLNTGRKQWAWFSWWDGSSVVPLFFGRLIAIPTDLTGKTVKLQFISRANDYLTRKYNLAQTLKVRPFYDPIFLDDKTQDDPDAILEAYPASWHIDRTTMEWTVSDILRPEDGIQIFTPSKVFYDSVKIQVKSPPLKSVTVTTNTKWDYYYGASKVIGYWNIYTWTGESLVSEWPKQGTSLGGGWTVGPSFAEDMNNVKAAQVVSYSSSYSNGATSHRQGDTMSANVSYSVLEGYFGTKLQISRTEKGSVGSFGMFGSSSPDAAGSSSSSQTVYALQSKVLCLLSAYVSTKKEIAENLQVQISADLQPMLFDVTAEQEAETISLTTQSPTTSSVSASTSAPVGKWSPLKLFTVGDYISVSEPLWTLYSAQVGAGFINHKGTSVSLGVIVKADNGLSYQQCTTSGITSGWVPNFSSTRGVVTTDGTVEWTSLGSVLQTGVIHQCTQTGVTGEHQPIWPVGGGSVADGTCVWNSLGTYQSPISSSYGVAGISSSSTFYFPSDRGAVSIEYCLARARARLLTRSRAIEISWETSFIYGVYLSCRQSAVIQDARIPGGIAEGKVIHYSLTGDGSTGEFIAEVKIGVPVGNDGTITAVSGTATYSSSYADGYEVETDSVNVISSGVSDIGYTPLSAPSSQFSIGDIAAVWIGDSIQQEMDLSAGQKNISPFYLSLTIPNMENSGSNQYSYYPSVTTLKVPKGIDLSAS